MNNAYIPSEIKLNQTWHLQDQISEGGFANVYSASSEQIKCAVVKLIPKSPGAQRELLFEELGNAPNVVPVIDRGECPGYLVLVMPRALKSLQAHLKENGKRFSVTEALPIFIDIAKALAEIDKLGVVHRDIKPANILLLNERWHLADFGIARYAEATTAIDTWKYFKTPPYAAPEQWRGDRVTSASDVYSFGVVAYELLQGHLPFRGPEFGRQQLKQSPEPISDIPDMLWSVICECLNYPSEARPRSSDLLNRLYMCSHSASPEAQQLQRANARLVTEQDKVVRQQFLEQDEAERRHKLHDVATRSLNDIVCNLHEKIVDNASLVQPMVSSSSTGWEFNNSKLWIDDSAIARPSSTEKLPFEVVSFSTIHLSTPSGQYGYVGRSHSLWYCDAQEQGLFRWYDTAFWHNDSRAFEPFALSPRERDAIFAINPVLHVVHLARPFTPIDQDKEIEFNRQWIGWFAAAVQGQLHRPQRMPEIDPSGSWRR